MGVKQLRLFDPSKVTSQQFAPVSDVVSGAKRYAKEQGLTYRPPNPQLQADVQGRYAQYQEYVKGLDSGQRETTPTIGQSYDALKEHVRRQYDFMTRPIEQGGMGISHEITAEDPYKDPAEIAEDLRRNKRIKTFATASTNVGVGGSETHQALDNETNDMFRAVHDVFGHAGTGRGFNQHGEEAAFVGHVSMFPREAHEALHSELRAQNAYLNFSPDQSFPDPGDRMIGLPDWTLTTGKMKAPTKPKSRGPKPKQLRLF